MSWGSVAYWNDGTIRSVGDMSVAYWKI